MEADGPGKTLHQAVGEYCMVVTFSKTGKQVDALVSRQVCLECTFCVWGSHYNSSLACPDPIPHRGKGSGTWP